MTRVGSQRHRKKIIYIYIYIYIYFPPGHLRVHSTENNDVINLIHTRILDNLHCILLKKEHLGRWLCFRHQVRVLNLFH